MITFTLASNIRASERLSSQARQRSAVTAQVGNSPLAPVVPSPHKLECPGNRNDHKIERRSHIGAALDGIDPPDRAVFPFLNFDDDAIGVSSVG